jgi:hypothetical protein
LQPDEVASCCGKLARGVRGGSNPVGKEPATLSVKIDPPETPFSPAVEPLRWIDPCVFNLRLVEAGWDDAKLVQPVRCCAAANKVG